MSLVPDCRSVKFYFSPTSEVNFAKSLPELGVGEYDFLLHLKYMNITL